MKTLKEIDFKNKKVLVRCGFDVPIEDGKIDDDVRIRAGVETIKHILSQKPMTLVIASHLGRPEGKVVEELSNDPVAEGVGKLIGAVVEMIDDVEELKDLEQGSVCCLENLRFWPGEKANDEGFAMTVAKGFDVYVNDAFSVSHRKHASLVSFPKFTQEKCAGLLFEEELKRLKRVKDEPTHLAVMAIGGAKIETKLPVIESMARTYDKVLVGGLIANEAIDQNLNLGPKVMLPTDFAPTGKEDQRLDIGPETIAKFVGEIEKASTIVWNGPMGKFEDRDSAEGTKMVMQAIAKNKKATQVLGGGETLEAVKLFGDFSDFDYVSMSGGAMLEFLAGEELPGLKALEE